MHGNGLSVWKFRNEFSWLIADLIFHFPWISIAWDLLLLYSCLKRHTDCVVSRTNTAKELVSHDVRSNVYNYKHVFSAEIVPVCKDDVVCLPAAVARQLGNMSQICVVLRVTQVVQLIDINTCHGECCVLTFTHVMVSACHGECCVLTFTPVLWPRQ